MKLLKICLSLTALAVFITACGSSAPNSSTTSNVVNKSADNNNKTPQPSAPVDELAAAKKIYSEKCVRCHKEDGKGGESEIDGVKIKAPDFTSDKMKNEPDAEFIEAIEKGYPQDGMPAFKGKISDQEIKDLVKLIRKDFQKK